MTASRTIIFAVLWQVLPPFSQAETHSPSEDNVSITLVTYDVLLDGSSPFASMLGRTMLSHLSESPEDAQIFEDLSEDPTYITLMKYISHHEEGIKTLVNTLWISYAVALVVFVVTSLLRLSGHCGASESQIVTCFYSRIYTFYATYLLVFAAVLLYFLLCIISTRDAMVLPLRKVPDMHKMVFQNLKAFVKETSDDIVQLAEMNVTASALKQVRKALTSDFKATFESFIEDQMLMDLNAPLYTKARSCVKDVARLARLLAGGRLSAALESIRDQCVSFQRRHEELLRSLAQVVEDTTPVDRWQIVEALSHKAMSPILLAEADDHGMTTLKSIDTLEKKLDDFEAAHGMYHFVSHTLMFILMALMFLLLAAMGTLLPSVVVGLFIHRRRIKPQDRCFVSHVVGYTYVWAAYLFILYVTFTLPVTIFLTTYSTLSECYLCAPYRAKQYDVIDDAVARLWPPNTRSELFKRLVPSEVWTKCKNESVSIMDLGPVLPKRKIYHRHDNSDPFKAKRGTPKITFNSEEFGGYPDNETNVFRALLNALKTGSMVQGLKGARNEVARMINKWSRLNQDSPFEKRHNASMLHDIVSLVSSYYLKFLELTLNKTERLLLDAPHVIGPCYIVHSILSAIMDVTCGMFTTEMVGHWCSLLIANVLSIFGIPVAFAMSKYYFRARGHKRKKRRLRGK